MSMQLFELPERNPFGSNSNNDKKLESIATESCQQRQQAPD